MMRDLRAHNVDILTLGQYLRPSQKHLPVIRYVPQRRVRRIQARRIRDGISRMWKPGPLVRSSYHASEAVA